MSFSSNVKSELIKEVPKSRHCRIAEISAITGLLGKIINNGNFTKISLETENKLLIQKYFTLLEKTINIRRYGLDSVFSGESDNQLDEQTTEALFELLKIQDNDDSLYPADERIITQTCCRKSFLRGAFLAAGSVSDPEKSYHFEITTKSRPQAEQVVELLRTFDTEPGIVVRKDRHVVYIKESEEILNILGIIGAPKALMEFENVRILKDMRNKVNRKVNCEAANINKTVNASVRQIRAIRFLYKNGGMDSLPDNLKEAARLRLENPDMPLESLGRLCDPPVGKSGMNHRLRRIVEAYEKLI